MPTPKLKEPKLVPPTPRKRKVGRPLKNPPAVLCDFCQKRAACWQRPVRLENGELLVHCDSKECDSAYIKLVYKTRMPFRQPGYLSVTAVPTRNNNLKGPHMPPAQRSKS